jgi:CRP-like cAMP-binding protein
MADENLLLAQLPVDVRQRVRALSTSVRFPQGQTVLHSGEPVRDVYFPTTGWIALELAAIDGETVELATVGHEGLVGVSVLLRNGAAPYRAVALSAAAALRIGAADLRAALHECQALRDLVLQYDGRVFHEIVQFGLCYRVHSVLQRLSRWLLTSADRLKTDALYVTQARLTRVLGVSESGVSHAVAELYAGGAIWSHRGAIIIRNRQRLERTVCECYGVLIPAPSSQGEPTPGLHRASRHG